MSYLMIENDGVCDTTSFTLLGASVKGQNAIGKFGTGSKHGVSICLREKIAPVIFCGKTRMDFETSPVTSNGRSFDQIVVKYSGDRKATEKLSVTLQHGIQDWNNIAMALREFVSNAIDSHECSDMSKVNWKEVVRIKIVDEGKVRAKAGTTRIFVPLTLDVAAFYANINKWFLHFEEPEMLEQQIMPKRGRNFNQNCSAMIYRRGVFVREIANIAFPSLFDYNIFNLDIDDSRNANDSTTTYDATVALAKASPEILVEFWRSFQGNVQYYEHTFSQYTLEGYSFKTEQRENWQKAFNMLCSGGVIVDNIREYEYAKGKGKNVLVVPQAIANAARSHGVATLNRDEKVGRDFMDATDDVIQATIGLWTKLTEMNMTDGKKLPHIKTFIDHMDGGLLKLGYCENDTIYINRSITSEKASDWRKLSENLLHTVLEELAHYITDATDMSRDFQDWLLKASIMLLRQS